MRYLLCAGSVALVLAHAASARAFDIEPDGMTKPDGSPRFVDPDEQFDALADGASGGAFYTFKLPHFNLMSHHQHAIRSQDRASWTAERMRLVFGPNAH
jgi:hypothetical protein